MPRKDVKTTAPVAASLCEARFVHTTCTLRRPQGDGYSARCPSWPKWNISGGNGIPVLVATFAR